MTNPEDLIHSFSDGPMDSSNYNGLTKREYFAGLALQGLLSDTGLSGEDWKATDFPREAVAFADLLIDHLNKKEEA